MLSKRFGSSRDPRETELRTGIAWNLGSLFVLAVSGLLLQSLIGASFGAAALGVFNQVFAWYISISQLAVMGAQFSVLKHLSDDGRVESERNTIATAGLLFAALASGAAGLAFYFFAEAIGNVADSHKVAEGVRLAAPGIVFFAINKVTLAVLNGRRQMRAFAVFQGARPLLLLMAAATLVVYGADGVWLSAILSATEMVLFVMLAPVVVKAVMGTSREALGAWMATHRRFGSRSAPSGILSELNARVDVIILGVFASDTVVGLYSFAAMLAEGVAQTLAVVRNNINPHLTPLLANRVVAADDFSSFVRRWKRISWQASFSASALGMVGYPLLVYAMDSSLFMEAYVYFAILLAGVVMGSRYLSFSQVLMLAGRPGWYAIMALSIVSLNILLNWILASWLGALGSAIGTTCAMAVSWLILKKISAKVLRVQL